MAGLSVFGTAPETVDWQQFYTPSTVGFGDTVGGVSSENDEKMRQAMLMANQINQANSTTSLMQTQAGAANGGSSTGSGSISSGSYSQPGTSGGGINIGSYSLPSLSTGGLPTGGVNVGSTSSFDPWGQYRDDAAAQLNQQRSATDPSEIYQTKLAQMVSGQFSPDDPSYQWRFDQGQKAAERSLAARGLLNSGNAAIELQQYGQGAASQEYGAQFDRLLKGLTGNEDVYNTQMNRLMSMAGVNLDPTAGAKVAIDAGQLGVNAQQTANNYDLGMRELVLKQQLAQQAQSGGNLGGIQGTNWSAIFGS